jgi:ABC-type glycerol-3-phosphate transport system permease component
VIDRCGRLGFFWRMVLPLSVPGVITTGILAFIASWNSYLPPLFILNSQDGSTLPLGMQAFASQYSVDTAKVLAFTLLSMIPALVYFTLFQRRIVGGLPVQSRAELARTPGQRQRTGRDLDPRTTIRWQLDACRGHCDYGGTH